MEEIIDQLVGEPSELVPLSVMPMRRAFFEHLVMLNNEQDSELSKVPSVSKFPVDLHRLYIAVRRRGGFKQVVKDKAWKQMCAEANSQMNESSAAGYQLRLQYQKFLLVLECNETGQDLNELNDFVKSLCKSKPKKAKKKADAEPDSEEEIEMIVEVPAFEPAFEPSFRAVNLAPSGDMPLAKEDDYISGFIQDDEELNVLDFDTPQVGDPFAGSYGFSNLMFDHGEEAMDVPTFNQFPPVQPPAPAHKEEVKPKMIRKRKKKQPKALEERDDEMVAAVKRFKDRRVGFKYSQKDVAESICGAFDTDISQTTISRFETSKLSERNMKTVRQVLEDWLERVDEEIANGKTMTQFMKETRQAARQR